MIILGVRVTGLEQTELIGYAIAQAQQVHDRCTVMYANIHTLNAAYVDGSLRQIMNAADVVYCDGAGVVFGARLTGHRLAGRLTGADWIDALCEECVESRTSVFLLGGHPKVAARAASVLCSRHEGLTVAGTHHGYLTDPQVCRGAIAAVNDARPRILLVGMGTPAQERWIAAHRQQLQVPVVWAVGALFDFIAGVQPRGPRWMLDSGLEWLYRLWSDPRRLWRRYLIGNPLFLFRILRQRFAGPARSLDS